MPKRCLFTWATLPMQTSTLHKTLPCHVSYDKFAWIFAHNNATIYLSGHSTVCRPHIMLHYWASANIYITFLNCVQIQFRSILFCVVFFFAFTLLFLNFQLSYVFNGLCKIVCVSDNWVFLFPFFVTFCASHQHSGNIRLSVIRTMTANWKKKSNAFECSTTVPSRLKWIRISGCHFNQTDCMWCTSRLQQQQK